MIKPKEKFMELAIAEANRAQRNGDYAIGAAVVKGNQILGAAGSRTRRDENPVAHPEVLAILHASKHLKRRHLPGCVLYTTHEPCAMCAAVVVWAKLKGVVYGARWRDMKAYRNENCNSRYSWRTIDIPCEYIFDKSTERIEVVKDFMRRECLALFHR